MSDKIAAWKKLWNDLGTRKWMFLLLLGMLLVVIAIPVENNTSKKIENSNDAAVKDDPDKQKNTLGSSASGEWNTGAYEAELEQRLVEILSQIQGAGAVRVMVTVSRSSELILQSDTSREESIVRETDSQGGSRDNTEFRQEDQTVMTGGSSTSQPYVIGEIMPRVEGVVVACEGGDRASVQAEISAAVQALFDLQPHKIKVCKMASP